MKALLVCVCIVAVYWLAVHLKKKFLGVRKMYGYFEYELDGEIGSSRDYGPMLEVDCVGAMLYRQDLGAKITFEFFNHDDIKVEDEIDKRYAHQERMKSHSNKARSTNWRTCR